MESFSRFASKLGRDLNINKGTAGSREGYDRTRLDRDYDRRRPTSGNVSIEQVKDVVSDCNEKQLDVIQDFFYDERANRDSSDKEILRAVDSNAKLLNKNYRLLNDIRDDLDSDEKLDFKSLSEANKDEILEAVFSNNDILKLLKEELVHFVASDAHDTGRRAPNLLDCRNYVERKYGEDYGKKLFFTNPANVIRNELI